MNLSEMKQVLAERQIQLSRSLGQNFLHDGNQLRRIVRSADLKKCDKVLEIGPGLGPLTEHLLAEVDEVFAIEKDARLVEVLRKRFETELAQRGPRFGLVREDALAYLKRERRDWGDWKLVANLPYSVASPILVELAQAARGPQRLVATLQIEVARRLMAAPGDAEYGLLTLMVQVEYHPEAWFKIPASCFFPEPDVDSACVCLSRRGQKLLTPGEKEIFVRIVKRSFSQRRKMMLKLLKNDWPLERLERAFSQTGLSLQIRAEAVSLDSFICLTQLLQNHE
jgi:16S rRNA (adenine1518-N6/adenine1519-N6)-dimethyltransferase